MHLPTPDRVDLETPSFVSANIRQLDIFAWLLSNALTSFLTSSLWHDSETRLRKKEIDRP